MAHYGGFTPKPQYAYSNSPYIVKLNQGKLTGWKEKISNPTNGSLVKTCITYKNRKGEKCYKGTRDLRKSEYLIDFLSHFDFVRFGHPCIYFSILYKDPSWCIQSDFIPIGDFSRFSDLKSWTIASWPREYPVPFAWKIVDLYPNLKSSARGRAEEPEQLPSALESFQEMPDDHSTLDYAELLDVFNYLRQNRRMVIPKDWETIIPKPLLWPWNEIRSYFPINLDWNRWFYTNNLILRTFFCDISIFQKKVRFWKETRLSSKKTRLLSVENPSICIYVQNPTFWNPSFTRGEPIFYP